MITCHKCKKSILKTKKVDYHSGFIFCEGCGYSVCINGLFAYKLFSRTSQEKEDEIIQYLTNDMSGGIKKDLDMLAKWEKIL